LNNCRINYENVSYYCKITTCAYVLWYGHMSCDMAMCPVTWPYVLWHGHISCDMAICPVTWSYVLWHSHQCNGYSSFTAIYDITTTTCIGPSGTITLRKRKQRSTEIAQFILKRHNLTNGYNPIRRLTCKTNRHSERCDRRHKPYVESLTRPSPSR